MLESTRHFMLKTLKFFLFWIVFGLLFFLIGRYIRYFIPLIGGAILAGIMNPLVRGLQRIPRVSRRVAVAIALINVILFLGGLILWFTMLSVQQIQDLIVNWNSYVQALKRAFDSISPIIQSYYTGLDPKLNDAVGQSLDKLSNTAYSFISSSVLGVSSFALSLPELFIMFVITLVSAFFISKNIERYKQDFLDIFPVEWRKGLTGIGHDFSRALIGFLKAQLILVSMTMVLTIFFLLILGAPYPVLIGFIAGLFGILPVLGAGLVLVPWALVQIVLGNIVFGIKLLVVVLLLSVIRHVVEPKILGDNVGLDPLLVIISMFIGLEAFGPIGLIIGPFIIIFYKSLQRAGVFKNL